MTTVTQLVNTVVEGVIGLIVVSAVLSWAGENMAEGPLSPALDLLGTVAAWALDPSLVVLVLAVGLVWKMLGSEF